MRTLICGIPFEIIMREPNMRSDANMGRCDSKMAKITIDRTMPEPVRDATLVHEWMHSVYDLNGIEHSEVQIGIMATELYRNGFRVKVEEDQS